MKMQPGRCMGYVINWPPSRRNRKPCMAPEGII